MTCPGARRAGRRAASGMVGAALVAARPAPMPPLEPIRTPRTPKHLPVEARQVGQHGSTGGH
jgi:hypothetical protein